METISTVADIIQRPMNEESEIPKFLYEFDINENYFLVIMFWWLGILVWWLFLNLYLQKQNVTLLQKMLTAIPILKFLSAVSYYLFLKRSPWIDDENEFFAKYLIMTLVTISSIYQSFIIGIVMVLSSGWSLLHFHMSRDYSTRVTVSMGITYLSYSAYYVSMPNSPFRVFMEWFITFIYTVWLHKIQYL